MAENTPPSILRERLRKTKEINEFLENELTEICEFTMYEKQLLMVEQGCLEVGEKNHQLQDEIKNLNKVVESRDDILSCVRKEIEEKKIRFSSLKDDADSSKEAAISPSALITEVLSSFDALSKYVENGFEPEEARKKSTEAVETLDKTSEKLKNGLNQLRQILETSMEEGARRLSDSVLIQEKLKCSASLFGSKEIAIQTDVGECNLLTNWTSSRNANFLDLSNVDFHGVVGEKKENLMLESNVAELERKLLELTENCQALSSNNEDLEKLLTDREHEIKELHAILNTPKSPCSCKKSTHDQYVEYEDMTQNCSILPVINNSFLPTIQEVKESSFDGSFEENNVPDFTSQSDVHVSVGMVDSKINVDEPLEQGDRALLERYRAEIADLHKFRNLLADELEYCMSEIDDRDVQITLLQNTLPVAQNLSAGIAAASDIFKQCNEEIESLEILVDESERNANSQLNAEVTGRLVNVLNIIQEGIDALFAVPGKTSADPRVAESSFASMCSLTLANVSSYPQQFCSIGLESSVDSVMMSPNVALSKPSKILKDVRSLKQSIEMITSDFSREFFNVISKLERVESIILWFRNMDSLDPESSVDATEPSKPVTFSSYKNVLIEDIREKACLILDLHRSRTNKKSEDSSQGVSARSSDESLTKLYGQGTGSAISNTDSSIYASAIDGNEANLHFMCSTDSKCDGEVQKSFVCSDITLSRMDNALDCSEEAHQNSDEPNENTTVDQEGDRDRLGSAQPAETILSAFWKAVNEINATLQDVGIPESKPVFLSDNEALTLEKVESYAEQVKGVIMALSRKPMFSTSADEKVKYDPDCTELLSLDITSLNEEYSHRQPPQTFALLPANQNIQDVDQEEKENSFHDEKALSKAVRNWKKLIYESNKRIAELLQSKNNIEIKLAEKTADNNNLVGQLNTAQSEIESHQKGLREKAGLVEKLTALIANKDVQLDNCKRDFSFVREEVSQLNLELKNTKEICNVMVADFMKQCQDLSEKIDNFQTEINVLQNEKLELDSQLRSARSNIEELETGLVYKDQLRTTLENVGEQLAKELTEKGQQNLQEITRRLSTADEKIVVLEREITSVNDISLGKDQVRASLQMAEERLTKEAAEKEKLCNNLCDVTDQLSTAENKIIELEKAMLDKNNRIQELQGSEIVRNEQLDQIAKLEHSVTTLTKTLEETRRSRDTWIESSSPEIDRLKTSLQTFEEQLAKELAEKEELQNNLKDVAHRLSTSDEKILVLEREISSVTGNLHEVTEHLSSAEKKVSDLEIKITAANENLHDNHQLRTSLQMVEEQLSNDVAEKEELQNNLRDVTDQLSTAENKITEQRNEILEKNNRIQQLQDSEIVRNEQLDQISKLEHSVTTLTKTLEETRRSRDTWIESSSPEIDQLKTSLQTFEERLAKELAEKEELQNNLKDVAHRLSTSDEKILVLEREISSVTGNLHEVTEHLSSAEKKVSDLEIEITAANENLHDTHQLRASLELAEEQLSNDVAEKEELQNNLRDFTDQLSTAENKITELRKEILEKNNRIQQLQDSEIVRNEQLDQIAKLEHSVTTLTKTLEETRGSWNTLIESSSAEIDQLKTSLKSFEFKLAKELAKKKELENTLHDVDHKLSTSQKRVSDLETEIAAVNLQVVQDEYVCRHSQSQQTIESSGAEIVQLKALLKIAEERLGKELADIENFESNFKGVASELSIAKKAVCDLECVRNRELETSNNDLASSLCLTRKNWTDLMKSSSSEIDRLTVVCRSLSYQQSIESLKCKTLSGVLEDSSTKITIAEETIRKQEATLSDMNELLLEKDSQISQLNFKYAKLSDNFQKLILNCRETYRQHDQLLNRIEMELATTSLGKENLSNLLEEALGRFEELKCTLIEKESHFNNVLMEREKLFRDKFAALDHFEGVVSNLKSHLTVAHENRKKLILDVKKRIDEINTSKKRAEVRVVMEIVERKKATRKLEETMTEVENLREMLRMKKDVIRDVKNCLSKLGHPLHDEDEFNQTKSFAENDDDTRDSRNDLKQVMLDTKEKFDKLCEAERSLSVGLDKEKASNFQLSSELHNALSTIAALEEKNRRRLRSVNDLDRHNESSLGSDTSAPLNKSSFPQNRSVIGRNSLTNEDEYEVTTYNATVHLEQSVFMSDLAPMERTMFGDNVDPLSMSIMPELARTPRKMDLGDESTDDSEFGTPVATKFWGGVNSSNSPRCIGSGEETPVDNRTITPAVTRNLAHQAVIAENFELLEKIKIYQTDLVSLQAKIEETNTQQDQMTKRIVTIQSLVDGVLKAFYNRVPELPMEENIVNVSKDITFLTEAIIESTGSVQNCLTDSVNMLISDGLRSSSHFKDSIASTNTKIGVIAKSCSTLKKEMLQFSQLLAVELASTSSSINSSVEQHLSSLGLQIAEKNAVIEELRGANDNLQSILLTASLEKESLRDKLNDEVSRINSLKFSFDEMKRELETKCNVLREECDENLIHINNTESTILELLRQWNGDEEVVSENVIQELKVVFGEAVHAKNIMMARTNKIGNFNFKKRVGEIISENEMLEVKMSLLRSQLSVECKNLSAGIKGIQNESKNLLLDFSSSKNEIEGALNKALTAIEVLGEESLKILGSKEVDVGILEKKLKKCQDRISDYETAVDEISSKCSSLTVKVKLLEENNSSLSTANEALTKDFSDSKTTNKELIEKLKELQASNGTLSSEMAKLQETILELNEKLCDNELLSAPEKQKLQLSGDCLLCRPRESELEAIKETLISVISSTKGKPIDLSCTRNDVFEKLTYIKNVLARSNDTLYSVLKLLNSQEMAGVLALECLFRILKSNDVRDIYVCKKKFADEIHGFDTEMRVEDLIQLELRELQMKLVSVIMEKEKTLISNFRKDYENELASKGYQLSQYQEREKYMNEMIEDLTKENEKLEETLSDLRSQNSKEDMGISVFKESPIGLLEKSIINQEEKKILTEEIETLNIQILSLKSGAAESTKQFKSWISDLEGIMKNFSKLLSLEGSVPSRFTNDIELDLKIVGFPNQFADILRGMFSRLGDMKMLYDGMTERSKEDGLVVENLNTRLRDVENEHAVCKETELKLGELHKDLITKDASLSKLKADYANLETQLNQLKKGVVSKENEVVSALFADKASLERELEQSKKHIEKLSSRQNVVSTISRNVKSKVKAISSQLESVQAEFLKLQYETSADNMKALSLFQNLCKQINGLDEDENIKVGALETEVIHLRGQLTALNEEIAKLGNEKQDLETSLANESAEKQSLSERLQKLEDAPARTGHDDKSCPYKEKVQEYKRELWIIRQKFEDEQKKFDVMKKNIEENLAFKTSIIKKLEERNEATVAQYNLRLTSSTTLYNQVCKKLEEAEERISFLRDMNSQDKKRLEKDIDNLTKEISKLQSVKNFVEGLGIDCDELQESLPEIKKKLSEYENLKTTRNEMVEKNKELDEECEFMNKQIEFLESRNTEMFKQNLELTGNLEKLKKELADNLDLIEKGKRLQEEFDSLKVSESKYSEALGASQVQLNQSLKKLAEAELKYSELQSSYKLLESNLESRNQKILHYVSEMKNYESMLTEKTKMNQEVRLALEEERSKYAELSLRKSLIEKDLVDLQKELGECHARLKELGSQLEIAAGIEASLQQVSAERDTARQSNSDLKSKLLIATQTIHQKDSLIESLRSSYEKLKIEMKENEDILKARERQLMMNIEVLKTEASDKAVRIVQLESVLEPSQAVPLESYKAKISCLEIEVETLRKELSRNTFHMSPRPQHVTVDAATIPNQLDTKTRGEFELAIHKLEKKLTVLKRLCQQRREKILEYENILRHHNIMVPPTDHSR